ncbi:MAG: hypothetical protein QOD06_3415 [Candidatus Binatota bacterium]|jgi:CBS domain-containing protein|nr:hypothetical protein [Candidatus Binatota bacterium]
MDETMPELGNEEYFEAKEASGRPFDERIFRQPITALEPAAPVSLDGKESVAAAVHLMREHHIGCVLVTDEGRLAGIFTERDLLREVCGLGIDLEGTPVAELMTPDPESLPPDAAIAFALNKMSLGGFRHVPLVDAERRPVGIVSVKDIVDYVVGFFPNEILTVPPEPGLDVAREREGA